LYPPAGRNERKCPSSDRAFFIEQLDGGSYDNIMAAMKNRKNQTADTLPQTDKIKTDRVCCSRTLPTGGRANQNGFVKSSLILYHPRYVQNYRIYVDVDNNMGVGCRAMKEDMLPTAKKIVPNSIILRWSP